MKLKIRLARAEDKKEILSVIGSHSFKWDKNIAKRYYDDYFSSKKDMCLKGDEVFVGEENGTIVGVIGYSLDRYETRNYWLGWFYVRGDSTKKGYGSELLKNIERRLRKEKVRKLFVDTSSHYFYKQALKFYIDNGFTVETVIKDYYGEGEDQIILSKMI
ncbi:MAG: GNAT family N-acetyltransferase [Nitrospirae bacterium]|nr:GNAT family N-acetyltransferase [Nitrospirota bacterium]